MIFTKEGTTIIVSEENVSLPVFLENLNKEYPKIKNNHIVINLSNSTGVTVDGVIAFLEISKIHRNTKKSFILVTNTVSYDDVPEELIIAPTLGEAKDIIEMEEIERDLGI